MINFTRRKILQVAPLLGFAPRVAFGAELAPTRACADDDDITHANDEGPYFKPKSPERTSLMEAGITGNKLLLAGVVLTAACKPIPGAILDFWQASNEGEYDNSGFSLRGHQSADSDGRFRLETVVPGLYPGRTRHIHVKVIVPGSTSLTTQLYFPGESRNARDRLFDQALMMAMAEDAGTKTGRFDFVLKTG